MAVFTVPGSPRTYDAGGPQEFGPFSVPNGATLAQLRLSRDNWPDVPGALVFLELQWRANNQAPWLHVMAISAPGGIYLNRLGQVEPVSKIGNLIDDIVIPEPSNNQRQVRILLTAAASFVSTVAAELI